MESHLLPSGVDYVFWLICCNKAQPTLSCLSKAHIYSLQGDILLLECVTKYMYWKRKSDTFTYSTMTGAETDLNSPDFHKAVNTVCNGLTGHCGQIHRHPTFTAEVTIRHVLSVYISVHWLSPPWSVWVCRYDSLTQGQVHFFSCLSLYSKKKSLQATVRAPTSMMNSVKSTSPSLLESRSPITLSTASLSWAFCMCEDIKERCRLDLLYEACRCILHPL